MNITRKFFCALSLCYASATILQATPSWTKPAFGTAQGLEPIYDLFFYRHVKNFQESLLPLLQDNNDWNREAFIDFLRSRLWQIENGGDDVRPLKQQIERGRPHVYSREFAEADSDKYQSFAKHIVMMYLNTFVQPLMNDWIIQCQIPIDKARLYRDDVRKTFWPSEGTGECSSAEGKREAVRANVVYFGGLTFKEERIALADEARFHRACLQLLGVTDDLNEHKRSIIFLSDYEEEQLFGEIAEQTDEQEQAQVNAERRRAASDASEYDEPIFVMD